MIPIRRATSVRSPSADKVVALPPRPAEATPRSARSCAEPAERWKDIVEAGSAAAAGLDAIAAADPSFDVKHFIAGARAAYEMIVTAFAAGDRRQLRGLLSREVFDGFDAAITERERQQRNRGDAFRFDRYLDHYAAELRNRDRADDRPLRLQTDFRNARPCRCGDRGQCR